jgi:hypothetical protein
MMEQVLKNFLKRLNKNAMKRVKMRKEGKTY